MLEAAYAQNPKPDKDARAAIVNQVAMGEKEVQVCFAHTSKPRFRTLLLSNTAISDRVPLILNNKADA